MVVDKTSLLQAVRLLDETIGALHEKSKNSQGRRNPQRVLLARLRKARSLLQIEMEKPKFSIATVVDVIEKLAAWLLIEVLLNNIQCFSHPQVPRWARWGETIYDPRTCSEDVPGCGRHQTEESCRPSRHLVELPVFG
jgi:hypothetical protein